MMRLFLLLMLVCSLGYGADLQVQTGFDEKDLPILEDNLRKVNTDVSTNLTSINAIRDSGFGIVLQGDLEVATDVIPSRYYLPVDGTFIKIIAYAKTAPTGAAAIIDVNLNGTTILDGSKITIPAASNTVTVTTFATNTFDADDYLTVDVDQIGSTVEGADVVLSFYVRKDKT